MKEFSRQKPGLTAIEMVMVLAILGMILSLLFPAARALRRTAKRSHANAEAKHIILALKMYRLIYGRWPCQTQSESDTTYTNNAPIIAELCNNPRNYLFLEIPQKAFTNGCFIDPWQRPYVIAMDENGDGHVEVNTSFFTGIVSNETAVVISGGPYPEQYPEYIVRSWKD